MIQLQAATRSAGFRLISAKAIDEAWAKIDFFDFGAVAIDYELKDDIAGRGIPAAVHSAEPERGCCAGSCSDGAYEPVQSRFQVGAVTLAAIGKLFLLCSQLPNCSRIFSRAFLRKRLTSSA
jgi:hypothetical protein